MAKPEYIERGAAKHAADLAFYMTETEYDILCKELDRVPAADVVSIEVLKKWLYENALNNAGSSYGFACVEISKRLDGLRRYAKDGEE